MTSEDEAQGGAEFLEAVKKLGKMRDCFQHLDGQVEREFARLNAEALQAGEADAAIWGTLRWIAVDPSDPRAVFSCALVHHGPLQRQKRETGVIRAETFVIQQVEYPLGGNIDHVTLDAFGLTADISRILRATRLLVGGLERVLAPQVADAPIPPGNGFFLAKVPMGDDADTKSEPEAKDRR